MYETTEEARQKLDASVAFYDGKPVWIREIGGRNSDIQINFVYLPYSSKSEVQIRNITDPRWDFKTPGSKLGFVPFEYSGQNICIYTSRIPIRHSRQGLDGRTVNIQNISVGLPDVPGFGGGFNDLLKYEGLRNTFENKFPTSLEAYNLVTTQFKEYKMVPFHRKLLLTFDRVSPPALYYKVDKVAYTEDGVNFKLAKHKEYLREELQDIVGLKIA